MRRARDVGKRRMHGWQKEEDDIMKNRMLALVLCLCLGAPGVSLAAGRKTDEGYTIPGEAYTMVVHRMDSNGISIYGRLYLPLDFDENRQYPVMIFSHGFNNTAEGFDGYAASVVQNGYIGYAFDFSGGSAVERRTKGSIRQMSVLTEKQNLLDVIADIRALPFVDASRVVLCGASMGGAVTSLALAELQEEIAAAVLIYPALSLGSDLHDLYASADQIPEKPVVNGVTIGRQFYTDLWDVNVLDCATAYSRPMLILHGDADETVPLSVSQEALPRLADAELVVVPGANHGASLAMREAFAEHVFRFLTEKGI